MDEMTGNIDQNLTTSAVDATETRDENRSPTSGSSSEALAEETSNGTKRNRKHHRPPRRKRKWRPYNELSWDEKKVQDDRESRRAFAKRERLSAEGHPIAPYNTTQFLMDDQKMPTPIRPCSPSSRANSVDRQQAVDMKAELDRNDGLGHSLYTSKMISSDSCKSLLDLESKIEDMKNIGGVNAFDPKQFRCTVDSPLTTDPPSAEKPVASNIQRGEDIQRYIMNDFSHMYAGIHAEQLQSMTKTDLIEECLKLERRVDVLERRVKDCKRKHKYDQRGRVDAPHRTDAHLLEKINQLQMQNAKLVKENTELTRSETGPGPGEPDSAIPATDDGAHPPTTTTTTTTTTDD